MLTDWQFILVFFLGIYAAVGAVLGFRHSSLFKNTNGLTPQYYLLGAFVWADSMVLGVFWTLVTIFTLLWQDWTLFLLIVSVFWLVRSVGETVYWFNQQFSTIERDPPHTLTGYRCAPTQAIWFVYQVVYQCLTVVFAISSLYLAHLWLQSL